MLYSKAIFMSRSSQKTVKLNIEYGGACKKNALDKKHPAQSRLCKGYIGTKNVLHKPFVRAQTYKPFVRARIVSRPNQKNPWLCAHDQSAQKYDWPCVKNDLITALLTYP
jgi:hypothetical protein